jgi:hypothetical protein
LLIAVRLNENIQDVTVLIHGPPQVVTLSLYRDTEFVEMPDNAESPLAIPQSFGERRTEFQTPLAHGFVTDRHPAIRQEFFDIAEAQAKAGIEPLRIRDNLGRKSVAMKVRRLRAIGRYFAVSLLNLTIPAGVTSKLAQDDRMLKSAAESGCTLLSIGFESITRSSLTSVHKHVNRPDTFAALVEKVHSYGIMVFGLFMFGFDGDDGSVFEETARFNIDANYDACAYSVLTPYPGTLTWYEMKKAGRIVSYDWARYDQASVVYRPARMSGDELRLGQRIAYERFYAPSSILRRFPLCGGRGNRKRRKGGKASA